jgi:hypothetical protein
MISEDSVLFGILCVFLGFGQECGALPRIGVGPTVRVA